MLEKSKRERKREEKERGIYTSNKTISKKGDTRIKGI
jgi:hypothetical protein